MNKNKPRPRRPRQAFGVRLGAVVLACLPPHGDIERARVVDIVCDGEETRFRLEGERAACWAERDDITRAG
jgi:hypothetical protein